MSAIGRAIKSLREEKGWTLEFLAEKVGMDHSMIQKREAGRVRVKPPERKVFAKAFGMSLQKFDDFWRNSETSRTNRGSIPVVNVSPAGTIVDYSEYGVDSGQAAEYVDATDINDDLAFAVRVVGDSMEPSLHSGDLLILSPVMGIPRPRRKLTKGSIVFVRFSPESGQEGCTIARWYPATEHSGLLVKDNRAYDPIPVEQGELEQLSVAIEVRSRRGI